MSNRNWNRNQYGKQNFQKNAGLPWNTYGIYFTCEYEKSAVREAQNIISKYLDESSFGQPGTVGDKDEELDIADLLQKEVEESKKPKISMRIRQLPTGIKHSLFFEVTELPRDKLVDFVSKVVNNSQTNQQCRFLLRALPIEDISSDENPMLPNKLRRILEHHYSEFSRSSKSHPTFAVDFKATFTSYKRQTALDLVCETVKDINPQSCVNLNQPDFTVIFHVIKKAVLLACVRDFTQRRKFSLRPSEADSDKKEKTESFQKQSEESTE